MEELFNRHKELGHRFILLGNIVKNNWEEFPPTRENLIEYNKLYAEVLLEMNALRDEIVFYSYNFLD